MISRSLDFNELCVVNPQLNEYIHKNKFDFSNQIAIIKLTETLIKIDLGYTIVLNTNYLCPNYFNRLDYVLFITKLIFLTPTTIGKPISGLDIGTSQSCIYPLLCSKYIKNLYKMIGTDINTQAIELAKGNIKANNLDRIIKIHLVDKSINSFHFLKEIIQTDSIIYTMCNPPFYSSKVELLAKSKLKTSYLKTETIGNVDELVTDGGDYKFVLKLINDSESYKDRVLWFTSLIGNHSTLVKLITFLKSKEKEISYGVCRFQSGSHTVRWILFWTFQVQFKPPIELFNYKSSRFNSNKFVKNVKNNKSDGDLRVAILNKIESLPYLSISNGTNITIKLPGNVFSRSFRRTQKFENDGSDYIFEIDVSLRRVIWRSGYQFKTFESFINMINSL